MEIAPIVPVNFLVKTHSKEHGLSRNVFRCKHHAFHVIHVKERFPFPLSSSSFSMHVILSHRSHRQRASVHHHNDVRMADSGLWSDWPSRHFGPPTAAETHEGESRKRMPLITGCWECKRQTNVLKSLWDHAAITRYGMSHEVQLKRKNNTLIEVFKNHNFRDTDCA